MLVDVKAPLLTLRQRRAVEAAEKGSEKASKVSSRTKLTVSVNAGAVPSSKEGGGGEERRAACQ